MGSFNHEEFGRFLRCLFEVLLPRTMEITLFKSDDKKHPIRVVLEEKGETSCTWEFLQNGELKQWNGRFCLI